MENRNSENFRCKFIAKLRAETLVTSLLSIFFLVFAGINIWFVSQQMRTFVQNEAEEKAKLLINHNLAIHEYINKSMKPNLFSDFGDVLEEGEFQPVWMSSTYAVREIDRSFKGMSDFSDYYYKEAAINARSPANEADDFERDFLLRVNEDASIQNETSTRVIDGQPFLVTLVRGETMESDCMQCHSTPENAPAELVAYYGDQNSFDRSIGEVVSAISIRVPLIDAFQKANKNSFGLGVIFLSSIVILFIFTTRFTRTILTNPLNQLRNKALEIAYHEDALGQTISLPFGKEFQDLTSAFNELSINLRKNKDNLEEIIKERTLALQHNQQFLDGMLAAIPNQVCLLNVDSGKIEYANREMRIYWGLEIFENLMDQGQIFYKSLVAPSSVDRFSLFLHKTLDANNDETVVGEYQVINSDSKLRWIECRAVVFERNVLGKPRKILHIARDITDQKEAEEKLRFLSLHDGLTNLPNRVYLAEQLEALLGSESFPITIMMADMDNLKHVNDNLGHDVGDRYLQKVAETIQQSLRRGDIVARIGGDEFAIVLTNSDHDTAEEIKKRIQTEVEKVADFAGDIPLNLSIGMETLYAAEEYITFKQAMKNADLKMYAEKANRKRSS